MAIYVILMDFMLLYILFKLYLGNNTYYIFQDFLGRIECTLGEIVGAAGGRLTKKLR